MPLKTKSLRAGVRAVFRIFPKQATRYTVQNVLWWLKELDVDNDTIVVPALCEADPDVIDYTVYMANLKRIWELKGTLIMGCLAQDVTAQWVGGPPNDIRRHKGSFLQLLMDRIMADITTHGTSNFIKLNRKFKDVHPKFKTRQIPKGPLKVQTIDIGGMSPTATSSYGTDAGACYLDQGTSLLRIGFHEGCAEWSGAPYGQC